MPNGFSIRLTRDDITPDVRKRLRKVKPATSLNRAIGVGLVGLTKEAFNNASLRPAPWVNKKDGSPATLKSREASMWRSIRILQVSGAGVDIGSDRPYASIHQLGGRSRPMPARPFFPVLNGKLTAPALRRISDITEAFLK